MKIRHSKRVCHLLVLVLVSTLLIACVSEQSLSETTEEPIAPMGQPPTTFLTATADPTATPLPASPTPEPTPTPTQTSVPTPVPTAIPTPTLAPTPDPTPTPTPTQTSVPTPVPTAISTPTLAPTPDPTPTPTPTQTPVPTPAPTATPTPTPTPEPTLAPTPTPQTPVPTPAPTATPTPTPTAKPEPINGDFTSEGVNLVGALSWHDAGYKGQGVKVGIIETGFEGFTDLIGQELPSPAGVRCYTDVGVFSSALKDCENGDVHGTATTETVIDTSPGASLYIAMTRNKQDLRDTVDWMAEEGVSVAALYGFGHFEGPGDGTSPDPLSALGAMDRGVNGGIIFVVPAGNNAKRTWFKRAPFSDADGDTFIDFASNDDGNDISFKEGATDALQLRWADTWGAASRNLDLHIWDTAAQKYVAHSRDEQSGREGDVPYEKIHFKAPRDGVYEVAISHQGGDVPEWIQLVSWNQRLEYYTESGSTMNPAESTNPGVLAVGAAHWEDIHTIARYSSRGPTPDGRIKPDVVGPTCGESATFTRYCGTSGSTPHLVGMAALVKQRFPHYTPEQVAQYLKDHAEPRQTHSPNNTWGHGFAVLPPPTSR